MRERGYSWYNSEPPPEQFPQEDRHLYNYAIFSCRTGNIYTASSLYQWLSWAFGRADVPDEVWEKDGRFYDPFRPNIEPNGFASAEEMRLSRQCTIEALAACVLETDRFVFTLGLTESWFNSEHGYEYPMCPGTVAGEYDPLVHQFRNQDYPFVHRQLSQAVQLMREKNPQLEILLTVSPVPLTATATDHHVLAATMYSKSVLRAVAGSFAQEQEFVDYFPSYEIINSPVYRGSFFDPNARTVSAHGVGFVMEHFFKPLEALSGQSASKNGAPSGTAAATAVDIDANCEEELLAAFGGKV